jgi:hypothetical protein
MPEGIAQGGLPVTTNWVWRPKLWHSKLANPALSGLSSDTALSNEVKLFHDAQYAQITSRQIKQAAYRDAPAFGLSLDVYEFNGRYISLAIRLPHCVTETLSHRHLIRMDWQLTLRKPLRAFARLNIENGPNTANIIVPLPTNTETEWAKFDLSTVKFAERRLKNIWVDLIFETPALNKISLQDIVFSRQLRAGM